MQANRVAYVLGAAELVLTQATECLDPPEHFLVFSAGFDRLGVGLWGWCDNRRSDRVGCPLAHALIAGQWRVGDGLAGVQDVGICTGAVALVAEPEAAEIAQWLLNARASAAQMAPFMPSLEASQPALGLEGDCRGSTWSAIHSSDA